MTVYDSLLVSLNPVSRETDPSAQLKLILQQDNVCLNLKEGSVVAHGVRVFVFGTFLPF